MPRVVINNSFGGFGLSQDAYKLWLSQHPEIDPEHHYDGDIPRDDPILVRIVEEMGSAANGDYADLKIVDVPDDVSWYIHEYDGNEYVAETHRIWC